MEFKFETKRESRECADHGQYMSIGAMFGSSVIWSRCPECQKREEMKKPATADGRLMSSMMNANVPRRYCFNRISDMDKSIAGSTIAMISKEVDDIASSVDDNSAVGRFFVISGHTGVGKTHLGCAMINQLCTLVSCRYEIEADFLQAMRSTWGRNSELSEEQVFRRVTAPRLLVMDEFAMSDDADWKRGIISRMIDHRYANNKTTVFLTNASIPDVTKWVGERAADRMRQCIRTRVIVGDSFREKFKE